MLVLLALWRSVLAGHVDSGPLSLAGVLTYTLIAEVFAEQLNVRTSLNQAFWEGTLVVASCARWAWCASSAPRWSGRWSVDFVLFSMPLLLAGAIARRRPAPGLRPPPARCSWSACAWRSWSAWPWSSCSARSSSGSSSRSGSIERIRTAIATLLSGALLPLAYYPWGLGDVFAWLPFAAMAWAPLAIYTAAGDPLALLASQVVWAVVLWPLGMWLWRANREKLVGYGG